MKNNNSNNNTTTMYKTTNGIQKLPNGTYRIRKQVNGKMYSACFKKRKDAVKYKTLLTTAITNKTVTA
jgi:hypothetical protein